MVLLLWGASCGMQLGPVCAVPDGASRACGLALWHSVSLSGGVSLRMGLEGSWGFAQRSGFLGFLWHAAWRSVCC